MTEHDRWVERMDRDYQRRMDSEDDVPLTKKEKEEIEFDNQMTRRM